MEYNNAIASEGYMIGSCIAQCIAFGKGTWWWFSGGLGQIAS